MASMREIKLRIKSVKQTRQITKAMKLMSAAKLKKARQQLEQTKPFFEKVRSTMADIIMHSGEVESLYFDKREGKEQKKKGYIVITSDTGLAGGYNHNIIKLAESFVKEEENYELFMIGHIGRNYFTKGKYKVREDFEHSAQNPTVYRARDIMEYIINLFVTRELDEVHLVYTLMESSVSLQPKTVKLLPLELDELLLDLKVEDRKDIRVDDSLLYEPSERAVFDVLVPKYIKGIMYGALVESFTSEHSARMTAMDNATSNADEMLEKYNLFYNRARQAAITQEITEIVGGAQALGNG